MAKKKLKEKEIGSRISIKLKDGREVTFSGLEVDSVQLVQDASPINLTVLDREQLYNQIFTNIIRCGVETGEGFEISKEKLKSNIMLLNGIVLYFDHLQKQCNCTRLELLHFCEKYKIKCGNTYWGEGMLLDKVFLKQAIKILEENAKSI